MLNTESNSQDLCGGSCRKEKAEEMEIAMTMGMGMNLAMEAETADNYKIRILKKPDVTDLAGEKVMIDFESGKYFMLTGSANDIWDMLYDGAESKSIMAALTEIYDVDACVCREGVMKFLVELENIGFISLDKCN